MKKMVSMGLRIVGGLLLLIALVSGGASVLSFLERVQHGSGLLFAGVEFLGFIAVIAAILGAATLFAAKKLSTSGKKWARVWQHFCAKISPRPSLAKRGNYS